MSIKQVLCSKGSATAFAVNATRYINLTDNAGALLATESEKYCYLRTDGAVFDHLGIYLSANTLDVTGNFAFRKNGAAGSQIVAITAASTGLFQDTTNTDTLSAGDTFDLEFSSSAGTGTASLEFATVTFNPTTNFRKYTKYVNGLNLNGAGIYVGLTFNSGNSTESLAQSKFRQAGTLQKVDVNVTVNSSTTNATLKSRINGATGNISVAVTASTTGLFSDLSNSDSVASTDLVNFLANGANNTITSTFYTFEFLSDDASWNQIVNGSVSNTADGTTRYTPLFGAYFATVTAESINQVPVNFDYTIKNLECQVTSNPTTSTSTLAMRINGATSALNVAITALTTGYFSDLSNTVTGSSGDLLTSISVNGGGGTISIYLPQYMMTETQATTTGRTSRLSLLGVG